MISSGQRRILVLSSWLVSTIVHLSLAILLLLWLCPANRSQKAVGTLHVTWSADEPVEIGSESFVSSLEFAPDMAPAEPPIWKEFSSDASEIDVSLPGSGRGEGRRSSASRQPGAANPAAGTSGENSSHAEFFGTVAYGDRFVFLLDMSLSMDGSVDQQGTRFDRAREELIRSIEQLDSRQSFCVILFCYRTRPMFDDHLYGRQYLEASAENKDRLKAWLRRIKPEPGTDPRDALDKGLSLRPSAVFLLSDGDFNGPPRDLDVLFKRSSEIRETADNAQQSRVPVHTIAYEDPVGAKNMQELSDRSGGEYRFVDASPEANRNPAGGQLVAVNNEERFASKQLALGKGHESLGRTDKAVGQYRQLIAKYPKTNAAREAAMHIERLKQASLASD